MLFRVGSITKLVTALTVVTEAKARGIPLDAPISRYMKGLAPRLGRVTLAQLLEHTAGVKDEITARPIAEDENEDDLVRDVKTWTDSALFTEPGDIHSYSNLGFILAGAFIEAVSGQHYANLVAADVLTPLGMTHATFSSTLAVTYPFSQGHGGPGPPGAAPQVVRPIKTDARHLPSTFLWASALDIARLAIAVMNRGVIDGRQVLDAAVVDTIVKPRAPFPRTRNVFGGLGVVVVSSTTNGVSVLRKSGRLDGYGADVVMTPSINRAFVVLRNRLDTSPTNTMRALSSALMPDGRPTVELASGGAPTSAAELIGRYVNGARVLTISLQDGTLQLIDVDPLERTLRGPLRIAGNDRLEFSFTNADTGAARTLSLDVVRDRTGVVKYLFTGERAFRRR